MTRLGAMLLSAALAGSLMAGMVAVYTGRGLVVTAVGAGAPPKPIVKTEKEIRVITVTKKQPAPPSTVTVLTYGPGVAAGLEGTDESYARDQRKLEEERRREELRRREEQQRLEERRRREEQQRLEERRREEERRRREEQRRREEEQREQAR